MRIIFLDVDGVLNNDDTKERYNGWIGVDKKLLNNLKILYDKLNEKEETKVVITSYWRYEKIRKHHYSDGSYDYLLNLLKDANINVIGETPQDIISGSNRGREIFAWIILNMHKYKISNYIILDDEEFDFDKYDDIKSRFIQTNNINGLDNTIIEKAIYTMDHTANYLNIFYNI